MDKSTRPAVAVLMGSDSDQEVMSEATKVLGSFGVPSETHVISAHRSPERCRRFAAGAARRGVKVIIAGAGKAAHLAGVVASHTTLPVIGVPLDAGLGGLDALLSTAQMPAGVPVACVAVGRAGAVNAALLAVEMLALGDAGLARRLAAYRRKMAAEVAKRSRALSRTAAPRGGGR
ncbi:5-(carboxyamino)imidazole ribonucleotide mutase [candidate division WOR-3 bacterium]|nr:5-(carboxyamino)imidazole ribonucleotide mutase [candidate division WOR-3 bacterium]